MKQNKKVRICIFKPRVLPIFFESIKGTYGGAEMQMSIIGRELSKKNFRICYLVNDYGQKKILKQKNIEFRKIIISDNKSNLIRRAADIPKLIYYLYKSKSDIFLLRAASEITLIVGLFCRMFNKKMIYMTGFAFDVDKKKNYKVRGKIRGISYLLGLRFADRVIVQAEEYRLKLMKDFSLKSTIIKNSYIIPKYPGYHDREYILWVGSSRKMKQPEKFIEIAKSLPEYKFMMVLSNNENEKNSFRNIIIKTQNIKNLKLLTNIPHKKINQIFRKARIFINTSTPTIEGFPNTFIESGIAGTPVFSLNANPDKFLERFNCGMCFNGNLKHMKDEIRRSLDRKSYIKKLSGNIYKYVNENHNIKKNILMLIKTIGINKNNSDEKRCTD